MPAFPAKALVCALVLLLSGCGSAATSAPQVEAQGASQPASKARPQTAPQTVPREGPLASAQASVATPRRDLTQAEVKAVYQSLQKHYGSAIGRLSGSQDKGWQVEVNGVAVPLTGGSVERDIVSSDIAHTLYWGGIYPFDPSRPATPDGVRPGRVRCFPFMHALYGNSKEEVARQLKTVRFMGQNVSFFGRYGAAEALEAVSRELEAADKAHPELNLKELCRTAGTFMWRSVRGENIPSPHSFATAIDLNTKYATFWRWQKNPGQRHSQQDTYPRVIVEAFERHGFVWGGKWHEYDIMHFEYRPEVLDFARAWQGR